MFHLNISKSCKASFICIPFSVYGYLNLRPGRNRKRGRALPGARGDKNLLGRSGASPPPGAGGGLWRPGGPPGQTGHPKQRDPARGTLRGRGRWMGSRHGVVPRRRRRERRRSCGKMGFCDSAPAAGVSASRRLPQPVLPHSGKSLSEVQVMGSAGTPDQRCRRKSR